MDGKGRSRKRQAEVVCQLQHKVLGEMDETQQHISNLDKRLSIVENMGMQLTQEIKDMKLQIKDINGALNKLIMVLVAFIATQAPASVQAIISLVK